LTTRHTAHNQNLNRRTRIHIRRQPAGLPGRHREPEGFGGREARRERGQDGRDHQGGVDAAA